LAAQSGIDAIPKGSGGNLDKIPDDLIFSFSPSNTPEFVPSSQDLAAARDCSSANRGIGHILDDRGVSIPTFRIL
jgi:hypothetical protein